MKFIIAACWLVAAITISATATRGFSLKEFWGYVPNDDERLSRQKRITTEQPYSVPRPGMSAEIFIDPIEDGSNGDGEPISKEALIELHGSHTIKTVSSKEVPAVVVKRHHTEARRRENETMVRVNKDKESQTEEEGDPSWPSGRYGIPRAIIGCPDSKNFGWKTGFRFDDTEDDGTENQRSDIFHLAGNFSEDGIRHEFCIKDDAVGSRSWPKGKYCLYKRGPACPSGMDEGFVIWDDENVDNTNDKGGALPEGHYTDDTKIYFCCRGDGSVEVPISLPVTKPFYLFAYESIKCQKVKRTIVTSEFIKFDDEDRGNIDYEGGAFPYGIHKAQKDHMLFLCYYERDPTDEVIRIVRNGSLTSGVTTSMSLSDLQQSLASSGSGNNDVEEEQAAMKKSEDMFKAFLVATGGEEDKHNKNERAKTIIKTIRMPAKESRSNPVAIVVGIVLGAVVVSTAIILIAKYVMSRQTTTTTRKSIPGERVESTWTVSRDIRSGSDSDDTDNEEEDLYYQRKQNIRENYTSDEPAYDDGYYMEEDEELVEDQLLPESELKNGLELMFLKQQRHYWNQNRRPNLQNVDYSDDAENETL